MQKQTMKFLGFGVFMLVLLATFAVAYHVGVDDDPMLGDRLAEVTIIEFANFQEPFSRHFWQETFPYIEQEYISSGKVNFVYRDFPLSYHAYGQKSAEASECADQQDSYWEYHDFLYSQYDEWTQAASISVAQAYFKTYAEELGLNTGKFNRCLDSGEMAEEVRKDYREGTNIGLPGAPIFFIQGCNVEEMVAGAWPASVFKTKIEEVLNRCN